MKRSIIWLIYVECLFLTYCSTIETDLDPNLALVFAQNESSNRIFMSQINSNSGISEENVDIYSLIETGSNIAVVVALFLAAWTFIITNRNSKKTEQLKRIQDIKNNISNENQRMIQNLLLTRLAAIPLTPELEEGFYTPVVDAAESACFLIEGKDIDKNMKAI